MIYNEWTTVLSIDQTLAKKKVQNYYIQIVFAETNGAALYPFCFVLDLLLSLLWNKESKVHHQHLEQHPSVLLTFLGQPNTKTNTLQLSRAATTCANGRNIKNSDLGMKIVIEHDHSVSDVAFQIPCHRRTFDVATMCPACFLFASHCGKGPSITNTTKYQFDALWTANMMHFDKDTGDGQSLNQKQCQNWKNCGWKTPHCAILHVAFWHIGHT